MILYNNYTSTLKKSQGPPWRSVQAFTAVGGDLILTQE